MAHEVSLEHSSAQSDKHATPSALTVGAKLAVKRRADLDGVRVGPGVGVVRGVWRSFDVNTGRAVGNHVQAHKMYEPVEIRPAR